MGFDEMLSLSANQKICWILLELLFSNVAITRNPGTWTAQYLGGLGLAVFLLMFLHYTRDHIRLER
jgi:hypothetical protein